MTWALNQRERVMIEHERSYVFTIEGIHYFLADCGCEWKQTSQKSCLDDYYLSCGLRVRVPMYQDYAIITRKEGSKAAGYRVEKEAKIDRKAAELMIQQPMLHVHKERHEVSVDPARLERANDANVKIVVDIIDKPMRLAVLEIESVSESLYPLPVDIPRRLFGRELKECPLCTTELFMRKIGICGGPSSGKSETAKWMSHSINTEFGGNAFSVAEFATTFIQKYRRNPAFHDQFFIWYGQRERERDAETADIVISDCPTFLAYIYMLYLNREQFSETSALYFSKMYKRVLFDIQNYTDLIFLSIKNYEDNNVRYQTKDEALELERRIRQFLDDHHIPYVDTTYDQTQKLLADLFWINDGRTD